MQSATENEERPQARLLAAGVRTLSDAELVGLVLGAGRAATSAAEAARALVEAAPLAELAWAPPDALACAPGVGLARASTLAAAFELGRRAAWAPPHRGDRCLDPGRVHELMRHAAFAEREGFHVVLLDVRGRLLRAVQVAEGSLTQCPVSPRDALRPAVREGAHGVVFVHYAHGHIKQLMWPPWLCAVSLETVGRCAPTRRMPQHNRSGGNASPSPMKALRPRGVTARPTSSCSWSRPPSSATIPSRHVRPARQRERRGNTCEFSDVVPALVQTRWDLRGLRCPREPAQEA